MSRSGKRNPRELVPKSSPNLEELKLEALHCACAHASLGFDTTDALSRLKEVFGQTPAFRAMELGTEVSGSGFNIFMLGLPGSGKITLIREYFERKAAAEHVSDDYEFADAVRAITGVAAKSLNDDQESG